MIFDPDDFKDRPYEAGLNQLGHALLGAALVEFLSLALAVAGIVFWELWQRKRRGATLLDYHADIFYWLAGAGAWLAFGDPAARYFLLVPLACFALEYVRVKYAR